MLQTSLVGLEAPNPVPSHNLLATSANADADEAKFKKSNHKTTLTIVQDFPKKAAETSGAVNINLVQGKSTDVNLNSDKKTTLTIVQDFRK